MNQPTRHLWLNLEPGESTVVPEHEACRHEIAQRACQAHKRGPRRFKVTKDPSGGTRVERVA